MSENPESRLTEDQRQAVEEFRKRHRTALLALLFTDVEGSTALKSAMGELPATALMERHSSVIREVLGEFTDGQEIFTAGDSFFLVFAKPSDAVRFALLAQLWLRDLAERAQPEATGFRVKMGIHLGEVVVEEDIKGGPMRDVLGMQVDLASRVTSLAGGGQILMTRGVFDNARQILKGQLLPAIGDLSWVSHGPYLLKGFDEPLAICEVGETGVAPLRPPGDSERGKSATVPGTEPVLGWRPAVEQVVPNTDWELERQLGEGGFGEVWLARHRRTKEHRVFKFCFRADRLRNLKREMTLFRVLKEELGARQDIARLIDVQFNEAPYYLEFEYTPGGDLAEWIEERGGIDAVPTDQRLEIAAQVATALAAAHSVGVIHKDVKPSNILIEERKDGAIQTRLTDFGIGQLVDREILQRAGITATGFTETVSTATELSSRSGTRLYMAPEMIAGRPPSIQSDVYSLGILLYQMLIGDLAEPLTTDWERRIHDPLLREDLRECFAGDPAERFGDAGDLARRLRTLPARRAAARRKRLTRLAVVATVCVAVIAGLMTAFLADRAKREHASKVQTERELYRTNIALAASYVDADRYWSARRLLDACPKEHRNWAWGRLQYMCNRELLQLEGHERSVLSLDFSSDGRRLASGSADGTARVWSLRTGKEILRITDESDAVPSVAFSPDGKRLAIASMDGTARIWDVGAKKEILKIVGHTKAVLSLAFSPDGTRLATGSWDKTARIWDAETGKEIRLFEDHPDKVLAVAFSPDGRRLATCSVRAVQIWDAQTGDSLCTIPPHTKGPLSFSPDGRYLATPEEGSRKVAALWDAETGDRVATFDGHTQFVKAVAISPDGKWIATSGESVRVWDIDTQQEVLKPLPHEYALTLAFSPEGDLLATGGVDNTIKIWETGSGREPLVFGREHLCIHSIKFTPDGERLFTTGLDRTVRIRDAKTGRELLGTPKQDSGIMALALSPDGKQFATAGVGGVVKVWDAKAGHELFDLEGHSPEKPDLRRAAYSPDGGSPSPAIPEERPYTWNPDSGREDPIPVVWVNLWGVCCAAFSPKGGQLATGGTDKTVKIWDLKARKEIRTITGHANFVRSLAYSPDGTRLATASWDHTAKIWNVETGEVVQTFVGHTKKLFGVAFSPDGKTLATTAWDNTTRLWDVKSGRELRKFTGHPFPSPVAFSPDGKCLAVGCFDATIVIYDLEVGRELLTLQGHPGCLFCLDFSPDGRRLASGSAGLDGTVIIWNTLPWRDEDLPGAPSMPYDQRARLYKLAQWKKRLPAVSLARRFVDPPTYLPGVPVHVKLELGWNADASSVTVVESIPPGWTAETRTKGQGVSAILRGTTISWELEPWESPGAVLEYVAIPPEESTNAPVTFAGATYKVESELPVRIEDTSLLRSGGLIFQEGVFPGPEYAGCQDAHILMISHYRGNNTGGCARIEEGDFYPQAYPLGKGDHKKILIRFDLSSVPSTFSLARASMHLYAFGEQKGWYETRNPSRGYRNEHTIYAARVLRAWGEGNVPDRDGRQEESNVVLQQGDVTGSSARHGREFWEKPGALGMTDVGDAESSATVGLNWPEWVVLDVTESVKHFLDNPSENYGWKISQDPVRGVEDSEIEYALGAYLYKSSEAVEVKLRPMLILIPSEE